MNGATPNLNSATITAADWLYTTAPTRDLAKQCCFAVQPCYCNQYSSDSSPSRWAEPFRYSPSRWAEPFRTDISTGRDGHSSRGTYSATSTDSNDVSGANATPQPDARGNDCADPAQHSNSRGSLASTADRSYRLPCGSDLSGTESNITLLVRSQYRAGARTRHYPRELPCPSPVCLPANWPTSSRNSLQNQHRFRSNFGFRGYPAAHPGCGFSRFCREFRLPFGYHRPSTIRSSREQSLF